MTFFQKAGKLSYRKQSIGKFIAKLKNAHFPHFQLAGQGVNTIKKQKFFSNNLSTKSFLSAGTYRHIQTQKLSPKTPKCLICRISKHIQAHTGNSLVYLRTRRPGVRIPHGVPKEKCLILLELSTFFCFYMEKVQIFKNRKRVFSLQFINYLSTSST